MKRYIIRRLVQMIPVLFLITFIVFSLLHVAGDPVLMMLPETATEEEKALLREALNLDKPFLVQYGTFLFNILQGKFGNSFRYNAEA